MDTPDNTDNSTPTPNDPNKSNKSNESNDSSAGDQTFIPIPAEELARELAAYQKALQEEYEAVSIDDPNSSIAWARKKFAAAFPKAVDRICTLVEHAEKDTTAFSAAKFIYQEIKAMEMGDTEETPLSRLINELTKD